MGKKKKRLNGKVRSTTSFSSSNLLADVILISKAHIEKFWKQFCLVFYEVNIV